MLLLPCCSLLSSLLYLIALSSFCTDAEFITQPVSLNTSLNSTVTFTCEATGVSVILFYVGETVANETIETPASQDVNANRGFDELDQATINGTIQRRQLSVHAREINNNTYIYCFGVPSNIRSDNATLTIQGLLDSVVDLDYTFINGSSVSLTWTAPYTLDNVPITGYYIVNGLVNITTTNKSIILSATNPDPCILNNVSVSPINDVGIGSSNNISFYYETVPLITPPVSVVPVIDGQLISLNISINASELCKGEYPNSTTVILLNINNEIQDSTSIPTQVNDQLMITGVITVPNNLNTFIVNVSLSNNGGELLPTPSYGFGFLGPVTNIDSSIDNCSTIDITWTAPTVDDRVPILYYILRIYDDITGSLVNTVSVDDTSYQFMDDDLFIHRYTYVITGVNELGEGISNNDTFSYQRIPRSVREAASEIITFNETSDTAFFSIQVTLECTGEAPGNINVIIQCNGNVLHNETTQLENAKQPNNITGSVSVPQYQQCNISIVFSNEAGSSEPFILAFDTLTTPTMSPTPSPTSTDGTATSSPNSILTRPVIIGTIVGIVVLLIIILIILIMVIVLVICYKMGKLKKKLLLDERIIFDGSSARASVSSYNERGTYSEAQKTVTTRLKTETNDDGIASMSYVAAPAQASADTPGGSEVMAKQVNEKENQSKSSASKKEAISTGEGATKEPIYSELAGAPATAIKALPQTEASSVQYADIDKIVPRSKATPQSQSYDDVVVTGSSTTVIGATGGDPPPIPDKKSKGAATTGQEGTNGGTDAARNLPHHVNDDSHFSSAPPSRPPPHVPVSIEGRREGGVPPRPPHPPHPPPPRSPPGSGEGGVQPGSTAADQATAGTGLVSYL